MKHIEVKTERCTACGICVKECPADAIHVIDDVAVIDYDACILCGACARACPEGAIAFEKPTKKKQGGELAAKNVWVFCEQRGGRVHDVALELLGEGRKLADQRGSKLCAVIFGCGISGLCQELIAYGADEVLAVDSPELLHFRDDAYASALASLAERHRPEIILAGATMQGRSFIPRVAATLKTGLTADCTALAIDPEGHLMQTRPAFGGNIMATILCTRARPQMATVRPKVMKKPTPDHSRGGVIMPQRPSPETISSAVEIIESAGNASKGTDFSSVDVIVAGGGGLKSAENFPMLTELAEALGGVVAASRTAVDRGWMPYPHQVGQTGKTVCPKLYIAVGISGAIQHLVGMQTSDRILAINSDPQAPIFKVADFGLVGDLFQIVPRLIGELRRADPIRRGQNK
jgi:electron transfer flavoprotein alpha subunit